MTTIEELVVVRAAVGQVRRALTTVARLASWIAPDVRFVPLGRAAQFLPGERFRLEVVGGVRFEYLVEAASEREVVLSFTGPWSGRERWSFIADGDETLVRRHYEVEEAAPLAGLAWRTIGRPLVIAHFKLELARFRAEVERDPGPRAEIADGGASARGDGPAAARPSSAFPVDEG